MDEPVSKKVRRRQRRHTPPGTPPGTLEADPTAPRPILTVIAYSPTEVLERRIEDPSEICALLGKFKVVWLNVDGLGDANIVAKIGQAFEIHRLALEDVLHVHQRPKVEVYEGYRYVVARMIQRGDLLDTDQLSLFLGKNFVVTFQEKAGDGFDRIRERIRGKKGNLVVSGADYLAYALLDAVIDEYFPVLESIGERLEDLEERLVLSPHPSMLPVVHNMRRDLLTLRRSVWPLREAVSFLLRDDSDSLFQRETRPYLADCYDHTVQLMDLVETYREVASGLMEIYLSSMSHRMNEVIKVLTIISTIFIPLTFLAGVYGMNFDGTVSPWNMPELRWKYGYFACLGVMALTVLGMLVYFRRKGWLGGPRTRARAPRV
jgi:magnesium transporter